VLARYGPAVPDARKIAVLRACALGDFMFALPALDALRRSYPRAEIVLLGRAWQQRFLEGRPGPVDRVVVLRGFDESATLRAERFDVALQLHGGGRESNPFVRSLDARVSAGLQAHDAMPLDRNLPYAYLQSERIRLLEAVALVGARGDAIEPRLVVDDMDRAEGEDAMLGVDPRALVVLQPGATDPRRCWPATKFAAVADALAQEGMRIAINGGPDERELVTRVRNSMRRPSLDLGSALSLRGLAWVLSRARLMIANDTGPLHLAEAVGCPTVGIYWLTNLLNAGALTRGMHRYCVSYRLDCPACGRSNVDERCPHQDSFVADVAVDDVLTQARALLAATPCSTASTSDHTASIATPPGS
jgi:ADP-heptose:LPS heptosyltransferase